MSSLPRNWVHHIWSSRKIFMDKTVPIAPAVQQQVHHFLHPTYPININNQICITHTKHRKYIGKHLDLGLNTNLFTKP